MNVDNNTTRARRFFPALSAALALVLMSGCGTKPLLTELETNKLIINIKGTYESNNPQPWVLPEIYTTVGGVTTYSTGHLNQVRDDSITVCTGDNGSCIGDVNPSVFMLDIAEMKLVGKDFKTHYKFSNNRQTFAFSFNDADPFFNGVGTMMDNDDVPADMYPAILIYVRKMLMDGATKFAPVSTGWTTSPVWDVFAEKAIPSFNFNQFQVNTLFDSIRLEAAYLNRVYPLIIPIRDAMESWIFNKKFPYAVLEIRFVVKNFVKKYEYENYDNYIYGLVHYYAFSDWLRDVEREETVIGGNILTVARCYIPGMVGDIQGRNFLTHAAHIIAIPANEDIKSYTLQNYSIYPPLPAPQVLATRKNNNCNIPKAPGAYLGADISQLLDTKLKLERFKYEWNQIVPTKCMYYDNAASPTNSYVQSWDAYDAATSGYMIPALATYAAAPASPGLSTPFNLENVPPGNYNVFITNVAPTYGQLYKDGEFTEYPNNPVTVTIGGFTDKVGNSTSIDFH